uniref:hypothetical protein n=1 Tax=Acetatifactor sp. TaxID=1872090 RepID=UPI004057333D
MKKEDLFYTLGDINNQYIKEAHMNNKRKNNFAWAKWGAIAACFALLVLCIPMVIRLSPVEDANTPTVESLPIENNNKIEELQQSIDKEMTPAEQPHILLVNEVANVMSADMDVQLNSCMKLPPDVWMLVLEDFHKFVGIAYEEFTDKIPDNFECYHFYFLSIPGYKDANLKDEYRLHDYVFEYHTESGGNATIAICSKEEPLRDYFIKCDNPKQSEINGVPVMIYGYQDSFMVQFFYENIYYDIETSNATLEELEELLISITEVPETIIEDVPADNKGEYNEVVNSSDLTKDTSEFFGGSYTDANGKFVIVLTEDTSDNRTAICKELGRSESNTTFVKGTYTLAYLTELQEKITNAMVNKELPFVVSSALRETTNNIVIGATTTNEAELAKLYALDTIGGAIKVEFSTGAGTKELVIPKAE